MEATDSCFVYYVLSIVHCACTALLLYYSLITCLTNCFAKKMWIVTSVLHYLRVIPYSYSVLIQYGMTQDLSNNKLQDKLLHLPIFLFRMESSKGLLWRWWEDFVPGSSSFDSSKVVRLRAGGLTSWSSSFSSFSSSHAGLVVCIAVSGLGT